jgi:hypothetical protein
LKTSVIGYLEWIPSLIERWVMDWNAFVCYSSYKIRGKYFLYSTLENL